ncbi:MAG: LytTR family transcriptional regulator [Tannerella sp.]|jgi:DNA-binding LytR/AlgR family response regulator|nr:LytTR family transcriptional regulator [Tannerella sp.]
MDKYLMIKTRDELLRINIEHILYFEADRNYTKLLLSAGIQFTFAVNIGKVEEMLEAQLSSADTTLIRVGKSYILNKKHILQINLPKQKLVLLANEGKPRELTVPKEPLRALKEAFENEFANRGKTAEITEP